MTSQVNDPTVQVRLSNLDYQRVSGGPVYAGAESLDKQKRAHDCLSYNEAWRTKK